MRHFYSILITLIFSFSAFADISDGEQKIIDMLLSGDLQRAKIAAKAIEDASIKNTEVIDVAAEVLLTKAPHMYTSDVDALAWIARSIGSTENDRYYSVLYDILTSSNDKKFTRHVKKALKKVGSGSGEQYVAGMYALPNNLYAKESDEARDKRSLELLMEGTLASAKLGARRIAETNTQTIEVTDTAAEILFTYYATATDGQIDTLSWIATALGQSKTGRYAHLLSEVETSGAHRKLRKYAKAAAKLHGQPQGKQYEKGMLDKTMPTYDF
ncbi:hypothetical protein J3L16_13760 [Alteromonas sp. 5E99-2]|uniref:hypothetical protein n=1 Tax=Alteromonas sp. 5E99-2 TaxID=2817683 RepID=UPI001A9A0F75|nr:hypothetical protein [Alteromonas sp. 5E99-2]MBO1256754.1 hypothetical protein [Alteromonas sp. 5E99-2]